MKQSIAPIVGVAALLLCTTAALAQPAGHPPVTPPSAPSQTQSGVSAPDAHGAGMPQQKKPTAPVKKVDLNNASLAELMTLPTVGEAEAKKIIAHRPYKSKGELVTKAGLPEGVYHAVKRKVELKAIRKPAPSK